MAVTLLSFLAVFSGCTIFTLLFCFILHLDYLHKKYSHIPGPKRESFFWGNTRAIKRERNKGKLAIENVREYSEMYGPVTLVWLANKPFVVLSDAQMVKKAIVTCDLPKDPAVYENLRLVFGQRFVGHGLLTATEDNRWKTKRHAIIQSFHPNFLKDMMKAFNSVCDNFMERLSNVADGHTAVNICSEFNHVSLDIIAKVLFGIDLKTTINSDNPFLSALRETISGITWAIDHPFHSLDITSHDYQSSIVEAVKFLRDFGKKVFDERKEAIERGDNVPKDVFSSLLKLYDEDSGISLEDVVDEILTLFIAGFETTAGMLSFLLWEIGHNPIVLERMVQEVDKVLGSRKDVNFDDLSNLQYTSQVIKESLRLHPPVPTFSRTTTKEEKFGNYRIPANTSIQISPYIMHRHPAYWSHPDTFDPERFSPENEDSLEGYAYFPFSLGSRNCIGQSFVSYGSKILISRFLSTFKFKLVLNQELQIEERMTHCPKDFMCYLSLRGDSKD